MAPSASKNGMFSSLQAKHMRLRLFLVGLAQDYWKDAPFPWPQWCNAYFARRKLVREAKEKEQKQVKQKQKDSLKSKVVAGKQEVKEEPAAPRSWTAERIEILEALWGSGHVLPGYDDYIATLTNPLGINSDMSILDLGAGLGDIARYVATKYNGYVTGMEQDAALASRGMVMSIAAGKGKQASVISYDPAEFTASRKYDCIIAREVFYRIIGKEKFFKAVNSSLKTGGGQIVFTDYILDSKVREHPAVIRWLAQERGVMPLSMIETIKLWKGMGFDLRVAEDQTELYRDTIVKGLKDFTEYLAMNLPDEETAPLVLRELDRWSRRMAAFKQGLKYCRFYGIKY